MPDDDIVRADPRARRTAMLVIAAAAGLGAAAWWVLDRRLDGMDERYAADPAVAVAELRGLIMLFGIAAMAVGLAFGGWLFRLAYRTLTASQYPPPGQRVVQDTAIRRGPEARLAGIVLGAVAVIMPAASFALWMLMLAILDAVARR